MRIFTKGCTLPGRGSITTGSIHRGCTGSRDLNSCLPPQPGGEVAQHIFLSLLHHMATGVSHQQNLHSVLSSSGKRAQWVVSEAGTARGLLCPCRLLGIFGHCQLSWLDAALRKLFFGRTWQMHQRSLPYPGASLVGHKSQDYPHSPPLPLLSALGCWWRFPTGCHHHSQSCSAWAASRSQRARGGFQHQPRTTTAGKPRGAFFLGWTRAAPASSAPSPAAGPSPHCAPSHAASGALLWPSLMEDPPSLYNGGCPEAPGFWWSFQLWPGGGGGRKQLSRAGWWWDGGWGSRGRKCRAQGWGQPSPEPWGHLPQEWNLPCPKHSPQPLHPPPNLRGSPGCWCFYPSSFPQPAPFPAASATVPQWRCQKGHLGTCPLSFQRHRSPSATPCPARLGFGKKPDGIQMEPGFMTFGRRVSILGGLHNCPGVVQGENQQGQSPTRTESGYIWTAI